MGATLLSSLLLLCAGCQNPRTMGQGRGLVYVFPGIEGSRAWMEFAIRGYEDAGVNAEVRVHDWWTPLPLQNLVDYERNRETATELAREIASVKREASRRRVDLVGYSGGGGLAVMVLEALPENVRVHNAVLVHPAIHPQYDLSVALAHVAGRMVVFHSEHDSLILGLGTSTFGNMDRRKGPAAGKDGFDVKAAVPEPALRDKLEQRAWSPEMVSSWHFGGHLGGFGYYWNRKFVAPYLMKSACPSVD